MSDAVASQPPTANTVLMLLDQVDALDLALDTAPARRALSRQALRLQALEALLADAAPFLGFLSGHSTSVQVLRAEAERLRARPRVPHSLPAAPRGPAEEASPEAVLLEARRELTRATCRVRAAELRVKATHAEAAGATKAAHRARTDAALWEKLARAA